jgi:two-component system, response regulator PdtaR
MESILSKMIRYESYKSEALGKGPLAVMLVDDDPAFLRSLEILVQKTGHNVVAKTGSGKDALTLAMQYKPDVIIMDVEMPDTDGISATNKIRQELSVPIIFCTGHSEDATLDRAGAVDTQAFLVKPFSAEQLRSTLRLAVSRFRIVLENEIKLDELNTEIVSMKAVNLAISNLMERFGIPRKEALEKIEAAARVRNCSIAEAANAISTTITRTPAQA